MPRVKAQPQVGNPALILGICPIKDTIAEAYYIAYSGYVMFFTGNLQKDACILLFLSHPFPVERASWSLSGSYLPEQNNPKS